MNVYHTPIGFAVLVVFLFEFVPRAASFTGCSVGDASDMYEIRVYMCVCVCVCVCVCFSYTPLSTRENVIVLVFRLQLEKKN